MLGIPGVSYRTVRIFSQTIEWQIRWQFEDGVDLGPPGGNSKRKSVPKVKRGVTKLRLVSCVPPV